MTPSPTPLHQWVVAALYRVLQKAAETSGGSVYFAPLDVTLFDHSVVQPDLLYMRRGVIPERIAEAPDLVVEVLSPTAPRRDRNEKMLLYAQSGVREYWIVDPAARHIEFLVNTSGVFTVVLPTDDVYQSPELPEVRIDLVQSWRGVDARR
jgi:Uma2 family endonuclease